MGIAPTGRSGESMGEAHQMPLQGVREIGISVFRKSLGHNVLIDDFISGFGSFRTERGQWHRADRREVYVKGPDIDNLLG